MHRISNIMEKIIPRTNGTKLPLINKISASNYNKL